MENQKGFWLNINSSQRKSLNFANWCNGEVSNSAKILDIQSQFSTSKIILIFLIFFSLKNMNLGAHFLLLTFFDNINFWIPLFSKMISNFCQLASTGIPRFPRFRFPGFSIYRGLQFYPIFLPFSTTKYLTSIFPVFVSAVLFFVSPH